MSAIVDSSRYFARAGLNHEVPVEDEDKDKKTFSSAYRVDGIKVFDDKQIKFIDGPLSPGAFGQQILTSTKTDTVYTGSSVATGYRNDGYINSFENMEDAVGCKMTKAIDCMNGPFLRGHVINTDVGINLIVAFNVGTVNLLDSNLCILKKIPATEFGPSNDMAISPDESTLVLANHDSSMTLVDLKTFKLEERYHGASPFAFTGVDFDSRPSKSFITSNAGYQNDSYLTLWDLRQRKGTIQKQLENPVHCIRWSKRKPELFVFGATDGRIHLLDSRQPNGDVSSIGINDPKPILRMKFIDTQLIGFNGTNNFFRIDESKAEISLIETGLPPKFIVRDVVHYKDKYYAIGSRSIFPIPISINL